MRTPNPRRGEIVAAYVADPGATARTIAQRFGIPPRTVMRWVRDAGVARPRGPRRNATADAEIVRLHEQEGLSFRAVAARVGVGHSTVAYRYYTAKEHLTPRTTP